MARRERTVTRMAGEQAGRWSPKEARGLLDEWARSGTSLTAFARARGIHPQRLSWWQKRFGGSAGCDRAMRGVDRSERAPAFVPITVRPSEATSVTVVVERDGTVRVELRALDAAAAAWVAALARALAPAEAP